MYTVPQLQLAELLVELSGLDRVYFSNSGAEANEAAIKAARKHGQEKGDGRYEIVTVLGSFHGRTMATIAATGQEKVRVGFEPLTPGFRYAPFDDVEALEEALTPRTVAIMLEPIQGEGGVVVPHPSYLRRVRDLCDARRLLLILDEVQTGVGRTGRLYGYERAGITPDIMSLAKGLGGGVPIGAMLATEAVAESFGAGTHGSTFGGNALTCAVAMAVLHTVRSEGVLENCERMGERLHDGLRRLGEKHSVVRDVRGQGLLLGVEVAEGAPQIVERCLEEGLIINCTVGRVLRLTPPLTVAAAEVDEALAILGRVLE
jgi:acetylornithine/succinyldiaminopimelate/putrescine aminotransferase